MPPFQTSIAVDWDFYDSFFIFAMRTFIVRGRLIFIACRVPIATQLEILVSPSNYIISSFFVFYF